MNSTRSRIWRFGGGAMLLLLALVALRGGVAPVTAETAATPPPHYSCDAATPAAMPEMEHGEMPGMNMGTPAAHMPGMMVAFDQMYIDMMIPHHASVVALAHAAMPHLTDPRLREMAQSIITEQTKEQEQLRAFREQWHGSPDPMPMDDAMMMTLMPGMSGSMEAMAFQMDPAALVGAFCGAENPDLAFIDLVIPHHEMAIQSSKVALEQAEHDELRAFAQKVIEDQQREIDTLTGIRAEITNQSTPTT